MSAEQETIEVLARTLSNWGRWGEDDELGCANLITPEKRLLAAKCIRDGTTYSLGVELRADMPQPLGSGRLNPQHLMVATGDEVDRVGAGYADDVVAMSVHAATHWDGLAHVVHHGRMYNDRSGELITGRGAAMNSITKVADALVTRGVLVDVARYLGVSALDHDYQITVGDLEGTLSSQGVQVSTGDALLIRTGHFARIREAQAWDAFAEVGGVLPPEPGIGAAVLPWLQTNGIAAVACDNWAAEWIPADAETFDLPVHVIGIVHMGLLLGEIFDLEGLSKAAEADGRYDCLLSAAPLSIRGAVGGPVHPIAIR